MIRTLDDLPDGVIGFEADGEIHAEDYTTVLIPAVERQLAEGHDIRMVLVFPAFGGVSAGASWQDLKMGVEHFTHWKKIALVTDVEWMIHLAQLFGWMTPGELKRFPLDERDAAVAWAAAD
ncbi:MAG: STAS/SEC14 domain-containing protein [Jiangellaceae bacterium]